MHFKAICHLCINNKVHLSNCIVKNCSEVVHYVVQSVVDEWPFQTWLGTLKLRVLLSVYLSAEHGICILLAGFLMNLAGLAPSPPQYAYLHVVTSCLTHSQVATEAYN